MPDTLTWEGGSSIHKAAKTRYYFGAYERTIQNNVIQEVDYIITPAGLTAMRMYNDAEGLEKIYYLHTDNLGSIQAVTDENKNTICSYYYTPWGGRVLLSGVNITDRGYTFHEHLEAFGLINMNGRVYDPTLARFLSPDPYIQAPDYTQNFNRYSYCYNNPFKYTDPSGELQIGPFYLSLNLGWGYGGGFYFGISAGVGLEGGAYAGISIGYNTSGSFSFSASAGIAGFYVSGGYDTKGGWNASAGWSAPIPSFGIVSFNTNMLGVSGSYSQNGGWSYNHMGVNISKDGVSFSPSVGVGYQLKWGKQVSFYYGADNDLVGYEDSPLKNTESFVKHYQEQGYEAGKNGMETINYTGEKISKGIIRDANGIIYRVDKNGNKISTVNGVTITQYAGFKARRSDVYISPHATLRGFDITIRHEHIHVYHHNKYGYGYHDDSEYVAKEWTRLHNPYETNKYSQGRISVFDVPNMVKNYVSPFPSVPTWKLLFSIK